MRRYLYEIDTYGSNGDAYHDQSVPFMPRVLAEKTAKAMNKAEQKIYGNNLTKYKVSKTTLQTKDVTPHGYSDWFEYSR